MTDRYVRNRRTVLRTIWTAIKKEYGDENGNYKPGTHPESLYGGDTLIPKPEDAHTPVERVLRTPTHTGKPPVATTRAKQTIFAPGDEPTPWDTKLTDYLVIYPNEKSKGLKTHWTTNEDYLKSEYTTIAPCSWGYPVNEYEIIENKATYNSRIDQMRPCMDCWTKITAPEHWSVPDLINVLDHSDDDSADSAYHVDSDNTPDSDDEFHQLPPDAETTATPAEPVSQAQGSTPPTI
jgi:hypothetical protein